jgi:hypothetical protein
MELWQVEGNGSHRLFAGLRRVSSSFLGNAPNPCVPFHASPLLGLGVFHSFPWEAFLRPAGLPPDTCVPISDTAQGGFPRPTHSTR